MGGCLNDPNSQLWENFNQNPREIRNINSKWTMFSGSTGYGALCWEVSALGHIQETLGETQDTLEGVCL